MRAAGGRDGDVFVSVRVCLGVWVCGCGCVCLVRTKLVLAYAACDVLGRVQEVRQAAPRHVVWRSCQHFSFI